MSELWKVVKEFLASAKVDSSVEKINDLNSLYNAIKDGYLLCEICNLVIGDKFCQSVKSKHISSIQITANIGQFLSACKNVLKMEPEQLFDPEDLQEGKNLSKVFLTLADISNMDASRRYRLKRFFCPPNMRTIRMDGNNVVDIEDTVAENDGDTYVYELPNFAEAESNYMSAEKFIDCQKTMSNFAVTEPHNKYQNSLAEFLDNEKKYLVYHLELLGEIYDYLTEKISFSEIEIVFNNFQNLKNAHNFISQSFMKVKDSVENRTVAHTVIKYKYHFLEYVPYLSKLSQANIIAEKIWKDSKLRKGIEECAKAFDPNIKLFDLKSILIIPMQHITRYQLHMDTMLKSSSKNLEMCAELKHGLEVIKDIVGVINKCERDVEEIMNILLLEKRLTYPKKFNKDICKLSENGRILFNGSMKVTPGSDIRKSAATKVSTKAIIIMETKIIIGKKSDKNVTVEYIIDCDDYTFSTVYGGKDDADALGLTIESENQGVCISIIFDEDEAQISKFLKILDDFRTKNQLDEQTLNGHSFRLNTFSNQTECNVCSKFLQGLLCQGYFCINGYCGIAIHTHCISKVKPCACDEMMTKNLKKKGSSKKSNTIRPSASNLKDINEKLNTEVLDGYPWYFGILSRTQANDILKDKHDGYYMVRLSKHECQNVISVIYKNSVRHIVILEEGGYHIKNFRSFPSVAELVSYYQIRSIKEGFLNYDTKLLKYPRENVKTLTATKNSIIFSQDCLEFKANDKLEIWSDYDGHIWSVGLNNKVGLALACCFL